MILTAVGLLLVVCGLVILFVPEYRGNLKKFSKCTRIRDCHGRELRLKLGQDDTRCEPIVLPDAGQWVAKAVVASEDKRFYRHPGVDPIAILRAFAQNIGARRIVSGASTINTLVVKLTEPRPRTLWTKIVEACHAVRLNNKLGKDEVLEQYLNRAPFGGNVVGIESASRFYFDKPAAELSLCEAALLAGLPQRPSALRPDRFPLNALERRNYVLERMAACGFITPGQMAVASQQVVSVTHHDPQFLAPHFCDFILKRYPGGKELVTTLDLDLQTKAETALNAQMKELGGCNVLGGAIVIIDVRKSALRAMVGSPCFSDASAAGQVNEAISRRSPGSALKPFVFARAIEQGMCSPETVVADAPMNFAGYRPGNFDRDYRGPVTIKEALVTSLNIPALVLAQKIGLENVVGDLRALGLSTLDQPATHYGISLAVGTCEVTLLDLANAYACLAREGVRMPLRFMEDDPVNAGTRIYSRETAYMISDMLSGDERMFDAQGHNADVVMPRVAWKTGTSSGWRDGWVVAWNPEYVVAVWMGNPDGRAPNGLTGSKVAPAAHAIFRQIYAGRQAPWYERPARLHTRDVCAVSGCLPNGYCTATVKSDYVPGVTSNERCSIHKPGVVSTIRGGNIRKEEEKKPALRISSPLNNDSFRLVDELPLSRQKLKLETCVRNAIGPMYWFVDNELFKSAAAGEALFWPLQKGRHVIACSDAAGSTDRVEIVVE